MKVRLVGFFLILAPLAAAADFRAGVFSGGGSGFRLPFRLFVPVSPDPIRSCPLVLYLHGSGGLGSDNVKNVEFGSRFWAEPENQAEHACYVLAPQIGGGRWAGDAETATLLLLDSLLGAIPVDPDRLYVTGVSLGGGGTWSFAQDHPDRFAAAVPVCGWGDPDLAGRMTGLPVWIFHGEADAIVYVERGREMRDALVREGSNRVLYTEYPGTGHDISGRAYRTTDLPKWMFSQTLRGKPAAGPPPPGNPASADLTDHSVRLTWNPVISDPETWFYRVMRDGLEILETDTTEAMDAGLADAARYDYEIRAVDYRLDESQNNPRLTVTTPVDTAQPRITSVHVIETSGLGSRVRIRFSEPMERSGLGDARHFGVMPERPVLSASPGPDDASTVLSLPPLNAEEPCTLEVRGILRDGSSRLNPLVPGGRMVFRPDAWMWDDIGVVRDPGSFTMNGPAWTLSGRAHDVHDTADACTFAYRNTDGDFSIEARIDALGASHPDSKAGLMIRETLDPGSPHFSVLLTRSGLLITHLRKTANGKTIFSVYADSLSPPFYLRLEKRGDRVRLSSSEDGSAWRDILRTAEMKFQVQPMAGLCVSSFERPGSAVTAEFERVSVRPLPSAVPGAPDAPGAGGGLRIHGAYPNPANAGVRVKVRFQGGVPVPARPVRVRIVNLLGQQVLLSELPLPASEEGEGTYDWDGKDAGGKPVQSGTYILEISCGSGRDAVKIALIR